MQKLAKIVFVLPLCVYILIELISKYPILNCLDRKPLCQIMLELLDTIVLLKLSFFLLTDMQCIKLVPF